MNYPQRAILKLYLSQKMKMMSPLMSISRTCPGLPEPFYDSLMRNHVDNLFDDMEIPVLMILDENGVREIKEQEEKARREQTLKSILVSPTRDFVVSVDGKKVSVSELEGKTVGLYFALSHWKKFAKLEEKEKAKWEVQTLESILVSGDLNFVSPTGRTTPGPIGSGRQSNKRVVGMQLFSDLLATLLSNFLPL
ncbi:DC1 domain-containing protein [Actinidia rufa]|uniref:DC1 domain-containing protein n=1 Tax=Actinidia rufa TaxID=165716 RepID=A0A7J0EYR5_9ERIC|nr:DC1 domain-containing protein [Actinidia rufa]